MAILSADTNVWRIERAGRFSVLIDGAAFFAAVRQAALSAQRSIVIMGWDLDSRTRLVGESGEPDDRYPAELAAFLSALVEERPSLNVYLLLWDYSLLYATEREAFPLLALQWRTPPRVHFSLDNQVPAGASQHQKIIVIDDSIAFSGGLDLTGRRWDTPAHDIDNRWRVDPGGKPYRPFHDVQAIVDGDAARALSEIVRERWRCVTAEDLPRTESLHDPWPANVQPDFRNIRVGIARTQPAMDTLTEKREVENSFSTRSIPPSDRFTLRTSSSPPAWWPGGSRSACRRGPNSRPCSSGRKITSPGWRRARCAMGAFASCARWLKPELATGCGWSIRMSRIRRRRPTRCCIPK